jgi:spore germination cell wall hydrolase CwlJ-like protein
MHMSSGDDQREDIIEYPENYEEMVKKLQEREDEQLQRVMAKRNVNSEEELRDVAGTAIAKRQLRTSKDHKPLKDRKVLTEAKSEDVAKLRERLEKETSDLAKEVLNQLPSQLPSLQRKLKGRVKPGSDAAPSA